MAKKNITYVNIQGEILKDYNQLAIDNFMPEGIMKQYPNIYKDIMASFIVHVTLSV